MKVIPGWTKAFIDSNYAPRSRPRRTTRSDVVHKLKQIQKRRKRKGYAA